MFPLSEENYCMRSLYCYQHWEPLQEEVSDLPINLSLSRGEQEGGRSGEGEAEDEEGVLLRSHFSAV